MELNNSIISKKSQGINLQGLYQYKNTMIKVNVYRDSYDYQSHAFSEFLTKDGWKELWIIPHPEMHACKNKIVYMDAKCSQSVKEDEKELLKVSFLLIDSLKKGIDK